MRMNAIGLFFAILVVLAIGSYIFSFERQSRGASSANTPQYDYVIIHVHPGGSTTPWLSDEKPDTRGAGWLYFTAKGIDTPVTLYGDITIMRIEEGSLPEHLVPQTDIGPAKYDNRAFPMVADESR